MLNTLSCIIVDDSYLDRITVQSELENVKQLKLLGSFSNAIAAMEMIRLRQPDVLFLDVDMPGVTGLQLFNSVDSYAPACIIISAYPEYAVQGFELKIFDYILKPLDSHRFQLSVQRLLDFSMLKQKASAYDVLFQQEEIIFKEGLNTMKINSNEIIYLEAFGDYTKIVTEKKRYLTLKTLSDFLDALPEGKFMRIHRSYVVAVHKVQRLNVKNIEVGTRILPIGKSHLKAARQRFK
ncbi:DNA-binding response regulator, LytR/AlgR family [Pedobacter steynii]|uniref:DNA-binding response regulator, LytR/AlgR family n=1 Tax=Pedobacter steynii TaxID=430522 RepID=A0A1H0FDD1_9SPHI|nr:LytTR family DNA-binding domain-containing protein [Pedobacter steynii]NQX42137.1 response regulator transcription factor [Pedobacter steynii]SDN92663.1 DNA-binding response regulator, LytR/AlgR family [Pedobacter steynii]